MADISRNAPCSCGSGKKFKHCCLGKEAEVAVKQSVVGVVVVGLVAVAAGAGLTFFHGVSTGLAGGAGVAILGGIVLLLRDPPPAGGSGTPGAINFGGK